MDAGSQIATARWGNGQDWTFDSTHMVHRSWMEMVAQLDEASMRIVVKGRDCRRCGLIGCYFAPRPNSYEHQRHKMLKDEGRPLLDVSLPVWDSVIRREDGTPARLHPQRQDN